MSLVGSFQPGALCDCTTLQDAKTPTSSASSKVGAAPVLLLLTPRSSLLGSVGFWDSRACPHVVGSPVLVLWKGNQPPPPPRFIPHSCTGAARPSTARYFPAPLLSFPSTGSSESTVALSTLRGKTTMLQQILAVEGKEITVAKPSAMQHMHREEDELRVNPSADGMLR